MSRLTFTDEEMERIETECPVKNDYHVDRFCDNVCDEFQYNCPFMKMAQKLKTYEDKEEQGLLIELPVTIGETVYRINGFAVNPLIPMAVISFEIKGDTDHFKKIGCKELGLGGEWTYRFTDIGKTVFLTRSEAEEALAKMGGK